MLGPGFPRGDANFLGGASSYYYRPQRSCGQGNVFTGVCLSTGGEGVCLSACWDARPPQDQADTPLTRQTPLDQADPPSEKQTPAYGLRAAGTHPTGMHSCFVNFCRKLHENEKIWTERGRVRIPGTPLDLPLAFKYIMVCCRSLRNECTGRSAVFIC